MYTKASNKVVNAITVASYIILYYIILYYIILYYIIILYCRTGCPKLHICSNCGSSLALHKYAHIYKLNIIVFNLLYM
jgi:hypothetical protein